MSDTSETEADDDYGFGPQELSSAKPAAPAAATAFVKTGTDAAGDKENETRKRKRDIRMMMRRGQAKITLPCILHAIYVSVMYIFALLELSGLRQATFQTWVWMALGYLGGTLAMFLLVIIFSALRIGAHKVKSTISPKRYASHIVYAVVMFATAITFFVFIECAFLRFTASQISNFDDFNFVPSATAADVAFTTLQVHETFNSAMLILVFSWVVAISILGMAMYVEMQPIDDSHIIPVPSKLRTAGRGTSRTSRRNHERE